MTRLSHWPRAAVRVLLALSLLLALGSALAARAQARTVAEFWLISLQMPPQLWDDGANLNNVMGHKPDVFRIGKTRYRITWANSTIRQLPRYMLRQQGAPYGSVVAGLYDRPLTRKQRRRYKLKQRLLWLDADVLLAHAGTPICGGITGAQLDAVLAGRITDWRSVFADWPSELASAVKLRVPLDYLRKPRRLFGRASYAPGAIRGHDWSTLELAGGTVSVQKLSFAEQYLSSRGLCAVPVDGVTPSEQTTRSRAYRHAYGVYYVDRIKPRVSRKTIRRWEHHLFGPNGDRYLTSELGRRRYLP